MILSITIILITDADVVFCDFLENRFSGCGTFVISTIDVQI